MEDSETPRMPVRSHPSKRTRWVIDLTILLIPAFAGIILAVAPIVENSATYDEVAYVRIACGWWRTGDQSEITRMGSPASFWKWQGTPALVALKAARHDDWIAQPQERLPDLLPWFRASSLWLWAVGLWATQCWAWRAYGRTAAAFAGTCYVLGPNLRAHGSLMTMEAPLWAFFAFCIWSLCAYVRSWRKSRLALAAAFAGVAFSMKFTAVLLPFLAAAVIGIGQFFRDRETHETIGFRPMVLNIRRTFRASLAFVAMMIATNLVVTGFAMLPLSERTGQHPWLSSQFHPSIARKLSGLLEMPWPVDWVGFLTQIKHQSGGGPSYLFGEVSNSGWLWYYPTTIIVKCPVVILIAMLLRTILRRKNDRAEDWVVPLVAVLFVAVACAGSKRNYGYRYLLPLAPITIVWLSALVRTVPGRVVAIAVIVGLSVTACRTLSDPLSYFNALVGGPERGRWILADSNLDWGQGLIQFDRLLKRRPELNDVTLFYFGDVEPEIYGIQVPAYKIDATDRYDRLPPLAMGVPTRYMAVSTSLVHGPWGPRGYFGALVNRSDAATTPDGTIRIYELGDR